MKITASIQKRGATDIYEHFFDNLTFGTLTTDHAASNYGQPVILENDALLDYAQVESLTIQWDASEKDFAAAQRLEQFGIRVTRAGRPLEMTQ